MARTSPYHPGQSTTGSINIDKKMYTPIQGGLVHTMHRHVAFNRWPGLGAATVIQGFIFWLIRPWKLSNSVLSWKATLLSVTRSQSMQHPTKINLRGVWSAPVLVGRRKRGNELVSSCASRDTLQNYHLIFTSKTDSVFPTAGKWIRSTEDCFDRIHLQFSSIFVLAGCWTTSTTFPFREIRIRSMLQL